MWTQLCYFLYALFLQILSFWLFLHNFDQFLYLFCVIVFQAQNFASAILFTILRFYEYEYEYKYDQLA